MRHVALLMLMKSPRFVGAYFSVMLFLSIAAYSANNSATMATAPVTTVVNAKATRIFDRCKANDYRFVVVANPKRKRGSDSAIPDDLNILVGDEVISKIELPTGSEVKNFSLNSAEKSNAGFEIKTDWGGGLDHYEVQFNFRCKENGFYLYEVKKVSFSTTDPDSGNFWDKKESKVIKIEPNLPIEKFVMTDYL